GDHLRKRGALTAFGRQDRDSQLWQFPHPPAQVARRAQPQDRRKGRGAGEEDPLLQAQQGTKGLGERRARSPRETAEKAEAHRLGCYFLAAMATAPTWRPVLPNSFR